MKKHDVFDIELDEEEQEISDALDKALERGELKSVPNLEQRMAEARQIAANTLRKDARVNIRISSMDLRRLKERAAFKGLPYQTFIASVLHEYAAGHFTEVV
ncbi:MAG: hypothetical protein K0S11_1047 [Gammaproteobacteria bacterium]|jgi:predicted DNA binding CopG/RHH family protein|nr:hypothetical protein [Gammaproteobacteria bacterium]